MHATGRRMDGGFIETDITDKSTPEVDHWIPRLPTNFDAWPATLYDNRRRTTPL